MSSPRGKELIKMEIMKKFENACLCAIACNEWAQKMYWKNLLKIYWSLEDDLLPEATEKLNETINYLTFEEKVKFFKLVEKLK